MKKLFAILSVVLLLTMLFPLEAFAAEQIVSSETVYLEDGSYCVVTLTESMGRSSKTGTKSSKHYDSNGVLQWTLTVTGTFKYDGSTATCTSVSHSVTISNSAWSVSAQGSTKGGNTAKAVVTMVKTVLGAQTLTQTKTLTLSCDKDGNLS